MAALIKSVICASFFACALLTITRGQQCLEPGAQCVYCNVVLCPRVNGTPIIITDCVGADQSCKQNTTTGFYECVNEPCLEEDPGPGTHNVTCSGPGGYPSAYECDVVYVCMGAEEPPLSECTCDEGQYFNTEIFQCVDGTCNRKPATCGTPAESGKLDDTFCYVCDGNLDAMVYYCDGEPLNMRPEGWQCGEYSGGGGDNSRTVEPPTLPTCHNVREKYPDPTDCRSYYECDTWLRPQRITCPPNYYYDVSQSKCDYGDC